MVTYDVLNEKSFLTDGMFSKQGLAIKLFNSLRFEAEMLHIISRAPHDELLLCQAQIEFMIEIVFRSMSKDTGVSPPHF